MRVAIDALAPVVFRRRPKQSLAGKRVAVFCAIGKPEKFLHTVKEAGGEIVASFFKPDHDPFHLGELQQFADRSAADLLVCTEKDWVKLPASLPFQVLPLVCHLEIEKGQEIWQQLLNNIQRRVITWKNTK